MKLNGWQRIGVLASAVWMLGGGIYTLNHVSNDDIQTASELTLSCEEANGGQGSAACDQQAGDYLAQTYKWEWITASIIAIVPVPLGWGSAYLVLFLVRWVKRGFEKPPVEPY